LYLLPLHAFELEGGLGLLIGGLLLLEQGLKRLVRALLLPELLPCCGEQGDLGRWVDSQLLSLLGLFLGLALPRPPPRGWHGPA
jgi:hypothetical protein